MKGPPGQGRRRGRGHWLLWQSGTMQNPSPRLPRTGLSGDVSVPTPPSPCNSFFSLRCLFTSCSSSSSSSVKTTSMTTWKPSTHEGTILHHPPAGTSHPSTLTLGAIGQAGNQPRLQGGTRFRKSLSLEQRRARSFVHAHSGDTRPSPRKAGRPEPEGARGRGLAGWSLQPED